MAELKTGGRFKSAVCTAEIMVVSAPAGDVDLTCGGVAMLDSASDGRNRWRNTSRPCGWRSHW